MTDSEKLDAVERARRLFGKDTAARMWIALGLETVPAMNVEGLKTVESPVRAMTKDEEVNLAMVVMMRELNGLPSAEHVASQINLPADLVALVRAGLTYDEDASLDDDEYVWSLPASN